MSKVPFPQIVGPTYTLASLNAECQRCVNLQLEAIESGEGKQEFYLRETPGLIAVVAINSTGSNLPTGGSGASNSGMAISIQRMHRCANGRVFFIVRDELFELHYGTAGTTQFLDSIGNPTGYSGTRIFNLLTTASAGTPHKWRMADNVNALFIMADLSADRTINQTTIGLASYNFVSGIQDVQLFDFPRTGMLCTKFIDFLDNYMISIVKNNDLTTLRDLRLFTSQFQISPLNADYNDVWDALDVFSVESSPDSLVSLIVNGRELWLFGSDSYEVFFNSENPLIRFTRINQAAFPIGCIAPDSVLSFQGKVFWLGSSKDGFGIVWVSEGYQAVRISTTAIELMIRELTTIDDAIAWTYQLPGHMVYVLSFPTENKTFSYDLVTQAWNELSYTNPTTQEVTRHRGANSIFAFGKNLVGDFENGKIYELSATTYMDNDAPIYRYRRAPVVSKGKSGLFFNSLELDMQVGSEVQVAIGVDPVANSYTPLMSIRFSDDNGYTWSNYYTRSVGKIGEYSKKVKVNRLGYTDQGRVFEVYTSEAIPFRILSAELDIEVEE